MGKSRSHEEEDHGGSSHASHGPAAHGGGDHEEHEGAPEWLISFADNVMLMMGVFVILLALNMGKSSSAHSSTGDDAGKQSEAATGSGGYTDEELDFALAVREAFNNAVSMDSTNPADAALVRRLRAKAKSATGPSEEPVQSGGPAQTPVQEDQSQIGAVINFGELATTFDQAGQQTIDSLAPRFSGLKFVVEIRGHASVWESMHEPERGYRLTYQRAEAVAQALAARGVPWGRMRLVACGDSESDGEERRAVASGLSPSRVEIRLTSRISEPRARD